MAYTNYHRQQAHENIYLQPTGRFSSSSGSRFVEQNYDDDSAYKPVASSPFATRELQQMEERDANMKYRIRLLKIVSRILAVILSAVTLTPLALTLAKYYQTKDNTYDTGNGERVPTFPADSTTVYTYVYFGISIASLLLNLLVLIAYCWGVKKANTVATIATWWAVAIMISHVAIWAAAVAYYRYGKHKVDGKWKDLWGWTCGGTANELQKFITNINFSTYCKIQVSSSLCVLGLCRGR